jgi:predicted O-linked N-acetylglucosamine transferase (SPINDLY family)
MDYRIVDAVTDPAPGADALATESLVRLEQGFLAYAPPVDMPAVTALPALTNGVVTFGSFNNLAKLSPHTLALWARLLATVPGARLVLKSSRPTDSSVEQRFREIFAGHGVDGGRITLAPYAQGAIAHLAAYAAIDIALDPVPYNGTVTTLEALAMGVPVVTLAGAAHAGRVGAAILTRLGRSDWIARSADEYLSIAGALAADMAALAHARAGLRDALMDSPIGRADMAGDLEAAYRAMWRAWCTARP